MDWKEIGPEVGAQLTGWLNKPRCCSCWLSFLPLAHNSHLSPLSGLQTSQCLGPAPGPWWNCRWFSRLEGQVPNAGSFSSCKIFNQLGTSMLSRGTDIQGERCREDYRQRANYSLTCLTRKSPQTPPPIPLLFSVVKIIAVQNNLCYLTRAIEEFRMEADTCSLFIYHRNSIFISPSILQSPGKYLIFP